MQENFAPAGTRLTAYTWHWRKAHSRYRLPRVGSSRSNSLSAWRVEDIDRI